jgi:5-methylcytosine-specific restriction endonuclease McrA
MRKTPTQKYIEIYESGGNPVSKSGKVPYGLRDYLIEESDFSCQVCGFSKRNPFTNRPILEIDHIDGHHENNQKGNLRVICPNCSAMTPNYKALNKGNGRKYTPTRRKKAGF